MTCKYEIAWYGKCNADANGDICEKHAKVKCVVCGEQATNECNHAGQFVCGSPLCDNCEGVVDTNKPSGSWGFLNHSHTKKKPASDWRSS